MIIPGRLHWRDAGDAVHGERADGVADMVVRGQHAALNAERVNEPLAGTAVVVDVPDPHRLGVRRVDGAPRPRVGVASSLRPPSVAGLMAAADEALLAARRAGGGIQLAIS